MRITVAVVAAALLGSLTVHAQAFKVEFDVRSSSATDTQPAQHFSMLVDQSRKGILQALSRVPTSTGASTYLDVGAKIECAVRESAGKAALSATLELTSITGYVYLGSLTEPIIGQRKAVFEATVVPGTPTVVVDSRTDSPYQVEATVTKLN